eukprot:g19053.t1
MFRLLEPANEVDAFVPIRKAMLLGPCPGASHISHGVCPAPLTVESRPSEVVVVTVVPDPELDDDVEVKPPDLPAAAADQKVVVKPDPTQSGNDPGQSTFQLNDDDDDVDNGYQPFDDQPIPAPQPPPQPAQLEELQTVVRQGRPPSTSQLNLRGSVGPNVGSSLRFATSSTGNRSNASHRLGSVPPSSSSAHGSRAPHDINSSISSANIIASSRERKQTPASHSTHHVRLAEDSQTDAFIDVDVASNLDVSEAAKANIQDTPCEEPLCFFTRALRIPQKEIHLHPDVVAARKKEIQGLFKAGCFRWVPRANAYRDNIKPIHTGLVDAVKIDEATGNQKFKSRLVMFGNLMSAFSHYSPYDKSAPVCSHMVLLIVLSLTAALGFDFDVIDFTQAYSQADMIDIVYAISPDDFEGFRDPEKPEDDILQVLKALYGSLQAGRLTPRYLKTQNRADVFTKALPAPAHRIFNDQITVPLDAHMAEDEDAPARLFRSDWISPSLSPYVVRARKREKGKVQEGRVAEVLQEWRDAREAGTTMYADIESVYNGIRVPQEPWELGREFVQFERFKKYISEQKGWIPFRTNQFCIRNGLGPCKDLSDCNLAHYHLQLNAYRFLFEAQVGKKVGGMYLAVFHPGQEHYKFLSVPDYSKKIATCFGIRRLHLLQKCITKLRVLVDQDRQAARQHCLLLDCLRCDVKLSCWRAVSDTNNEQQRRQAWEKLVIPTVLDEDIPRKALQCWVGIGHQQTEVEVVTHRNIPDGCRVFGF